MGAGEEVGNKIKGKGIKIFIVYLQKPQSETTTSRRMRKGSRLYAAGAGTSLSTLNKILKSLLLPQGVPGTWRTSFFMVLLW